MDEPFSALDVLTAENLRGELLELWEGKRFPTKSIVMVTHNIEEAVLLADRILVLGSNPGRIHAEIVNPLERPRQRRTPRFDELVDRLYGIMTGRSGPADSAAPTRVRRGTPGDTPLPHATVDGLSGLTELLHTRSGRSDLADLAEILSLEIDDLLPLVDALVLLGFAALDEDNLRLTPVGETFAAANIQESKRIFARAVLERAPLVRTIASALRGSADGSLPAGFFTDILGRTYGEEAAETQLHVAINWGRYAELYAFDASREVILREDEAMTLVAEEEAREVGRGTLRIYLGAAPGAGTTFAMLREGQARRAAGEDVVIAVVDAHGRPHTREAVDGLEVVPAQVVKGADGDAREIDLAAVLARRPQTALVDDLEHSAAVDGTTHARYQDVEAMQAAGINIITTLDVGSVGSVRDLVAEVTGAPAGAAVPESVLAGADEIQLVDISPVALRQRLRHGNIYAAAEIDSALKTTFDIAHLAALREIALQVVSSRVASGRPAAGPGQDVLVAVSGLPSGEHLIGRGARLARRTGGSCSVLAVMPPDTDADVDADPGLEHLRDLSALTGARFMVRASDEVSRTIEEVARELVAGHVVMGMPAPPGWLGRFRPTLADRLLTMLPDLHLHILAPTGPAMSAPSEADTAAAPAAALSSAVPPGAAGSGALRVYLGYARGCGATSAMLDEAHRRASRGADVVIAAADTHGQPAVERDLQGLEVVGAQPEGPGADVLDVDAVLARHPQVVCIDDLAGPTASGESRLDGARRLVAAGIAVIATAQAGDPSSTAPEGGAGAAGSGPGAGDEEVLAAADEIELVDLSPPALVDRVRGGLVVGAADVDRCLAGEFALDRLTTQRDGALRLVARYADQQLGAYLRERRADRPSEIRPRVLACVPPHPGMDAIVRVAAGHAALLDGEYVIATVQAHTPSTRGAAALAHYTQVAHEMGVQLVTLTGSPVGRAVADYARENLVTEIILGRRRAGRRRRTVLHELLRRAPGADVHVLPAVTV